MRNSKENDISSLLQRPCREIGTGDTDFNHFKKKQSIGFDFPKEANAKELLSVPYDS